MSLPPRNLTPAQAALALGVSVKTLRLYEDHGVLSPDRRENGWRAYDAGTMKRAHQVVALRGLGLSLRQVGRVLAGDSSVLDAALAERERRLVEQAQGTASMLERIRSLRASLMRGDGYEASAVSQMMTGDPPISIGFALPWPWAGEWFALLDLPKLSFLTGPLGSGKTRLAEALASSVPGAAYLSCERLSDPAVARALAADADLSERVERRLAWLADEGAEHSAALLALVVALEAKARPLLVVDMVEEGLSEADQTAFMAHLRLCGSGQRTLVLMTRSSAILDLEAITPSELVIYCPANHAPPVSVVPHPGGRGHEAVSTCIASPEVRARSAGVVAMRVPTRQSDTAA
jgi:DNA-binding transcriptional MerR regulator